MPLLMHAVVWWLAGLLLAAWWPGPLPLLSVALAVVVCGATRRYEALLLPAALGAAWSASRARAQCTALLHQRAQAEQPLVVRFSDVHPGQGRRPTQGRGHALARHAGIRCTVPVTVQFVSPPTGHAPAGPPVGAPVMVRATSLALEGSLRLGAVTVLRAAAAEWRADPFVAWRARLGAVIDARFRARAPLVRALLIADQGAIDVELRDRYADAGLVHLLSVSGMHVAIVAGALLAVGAALRLPRAWVEPAAMVLVALYILLLGCPAPAVRSGVMLLVMSLSVRLQRPVHEWTALALGAAVPTANPLVVHDLGWQLSVAGMAALVAARAFRRRWKRRPRQVATAAASAWRQRWWRGWHWLHSRRGVGGWLVGEITTGVTATLITAPIIAWTFGRISLIAPFSNLAAGPVVGLMQPALFMALLWALVMPDRQADWLPDATQPLMALLDSIAAVAAAVPGGVVPVAPTLWTAVGLGVAAALVVRGSSDRSAGPWLKSAGVIAVATLYAPLVARGTGQLELHVLDVGQGDALALRTPRGRWVLVDAGRRWDGGDAGRRVIVPYLRRLGGELALFVLTHPHDDHAGGAASVVRALRPRLWWESAFVASGDGYRQALVALRETGTRWERVHPGRRFTLDGVHLTVLAPDSAWTAAQHDANETSVMLQVQYGRHRWLLTGDAEREEEAWVLRRYGTGALHAQVLKVGHHGSRTSSSVSLIDAVAPQLAIASVGAGNRYGHPAPETLDAFWQRGVPVLRTDLDGTIVVRSDGRTQQVVVRGARWTLPSAPEVR